MEIICNQNELNNAIQLVSKAVASRPTHPILANILLTADEGTNKISMTGFDLNLGIQTSFDGTVKNSGAITIPSKLLSEIVNKLPNVTPVSLEVDENSDTILIKSLIVVVLVGTVEFLNLIACLLNLQRKEYV